MLNCFGNEYFFQVGATDSYIDRFCDYLKLERNYSERTVQSYRIDLELFSSFLERTDRNSDFLAVNQRTVRAWVAEMMENNCRPATVNRRLSALRSFYRFLRAGNIVASSPLTGIKGPKGKKPLPQFVRESDMDLLLDNTDMGSGFEGVLSKAVVATFYETGIRLAELVGIDDCDVSFDTNTIKVTGKRNKQRIIPFGNDLAVILSDYKAVRDRLPSLSSSALFVNSKGDRIPRYQVYRIVHNMLGRVSSVDKRSPHVLRHTFATAMLNHDAELGVVKELLGHESLSTTEIYTHTTSEELKKIYKQAHPRA